MTSVRRNDRQRRDGHTILPGDGDDFNNDDPATRNGREKDIPPPAPMKSYRTKARRNEVTEERDLEGTNDMYEW